MGFEYRTATRSEISALARTLAGKRLIDIDPNAPMAPSSAKNKGAVGKIFEFAFGIEPELPAGSGLSRCRHRTEVRTDSGS